MSKKLQLIIVIGLVLKCFSFAQARTLLNFQGEIAKLSPLCAEESCDLPYSKRLSYSFSSQQPIDPELKKILERISFNQAQIWGDTILEGDYAAEGNTRLDKIVQLFRNDELIGYLITYSERAWNTSDCQYDGIHDSTLAGCVEGRIYESSYVSIDFKEYFYDSKTMAVFK